MRIVTVEIDNENGFDLLQDLEKLHVLRIIENNVMESKTKLSDKYRGVFSKADADSFNHHTQSMRNEWGSISLM